MVSSHRQEIVLADLCLERADDSRQMAIHFAECEAQLVRIRSVRCPTKSAPL